MIILTIVCNLITGFCLGTMYWMWKIRKIQNKNRKYLEEIDILLDEQVKRANELEKDPANTKITEEDFQKTEEDFQKAKVIANKLVHIGGRLEASSEFFK